MIETHVDSIPTDAPPTIDPNTSASTAAQLLRSPETEALVVADGDDVVGVVTESDIVALVAEERTELPVSAFMSDSPVTTTPQMTVTAAADRMRDAGVKHLPVVADGECCGLVSATTLTRYVSRRRLDITWDGEPFCPPEPIETVEPSPAD